MHYAIMPCFFWHDKESLNNVIWSVASTFHFDPEVLERMWLSWTPLKGLYYWFEGAEKLAKEIEGNDK